MAEYTDACFVFRMHCDQKSVWLITICAEIGLPKLTTVRSQSITQSRRCVSDVCLNKVVECNRL